jgi:hypothetical protein
MAEEAHGWEGSLGVKFRLKGGAFRNGYMGVEVMGQTLRFCAGAFARDIYSNLL